METSKKLMEISKELIDKYKKAEEELTEMHKRISELENTQWNIKAVARRYLIENKLYLSMDQLRDYANTEIKEIILVLSDGDTKELRDDEVLEIDKDGKPYYSSYEGGIFEWSGSENKYAFHYYGRPKYYEVVGFYNLKIGDWKNAEYKEGSDLFDLVENNLTE